MTADFWIAVERTFTLVRIALLDGGHKTLAAEFDAALEAASSTPLVARSQRAAAEGVPRALLREWERLFAYAEGMCTGLRERDGSDVDRMLSDYEAKFKAARERAKSQALAALQPPAADNAIRKSVGEADV